MALAFAGDRATTVHWTDELKLATIGPPDRKTKVIFSSTALSEVRSLGAHKTE
jgi:hypothetical protein